MNVGLGKLAEGAWRELTDDEMSQINDMIATSSKTEEASKDRQKQSSKPRNKRKFTPKNKTRFQPKRKRRR